MHLENRGKLATQNCFNEKLQTRWHRQKKVAKWTDSWAGQSSAWDTTTLLASLFSPPRPLRWMSPMWLTDSEAFMPELCQTISLDYPAVKHKARRSISQLFLFMLSFAADAERNRTWNDDHKRDSTPDWFQIPTMLFIMTFYQRDTWIYCLFRLF